MDNERRDELISRVVDRRESAADWDALANAESEQPGVWRELAQALRCEAELRSVMASETSRADSIDLPAPVETRKSLPTWSGWATAAAIFVAWMFASQTAEPFSPQDDVQVVDSNSSSHADEHVASGENPVEDTTPGTIAEASDSSVIAELPMVVVETKPATSGDGYEVVYLRRVLESRLVDHVLELTPDEAGGLRPVPVDDSKLQRPQVL